MSPITDIDQVLWDIKGHAVALAPHSYLGPLVFAAAVCVDVYSPNAHVKE